MAQSFGTPENPDIVGDGEYWLTPKENASTACMIQLLGGTCLFPASQGGLPISHPEMNAQHEEHNRMLCYDSLRSNDVRQYLVQRGLSTAGGNATRCRALDSADKIPMFERFTYLAAEIRKMIYEEYFVYFQSSQLPLGCKQPPLTQINRSVRKECLPVFYRTCNFRLAIIRDSHEDDEIDMYGYGIAIYGEVPEPYGVSDLGQDTFTIFATSRSTSTSHFIRRPCR